jgi:transcriptional regulator with XRE-family HTH domain
MIAPNLVAEIRRALADGSFSQRQIARLMGVSRGTVGAIAAGKRPDYQARQDLAKEQWEEPTGPPVRCPGCGGMVYMPCVLCRARNAEIEKLRPTPNTWPNTLPPYGEIVELNLRPEHRIRYEQVRDRRIEGATREGKGDRHIFGPERTER